MITNPQRRQPDPTHQKLLQMSGDVHPNQGPATKYPCPLCTCNVTSRGMIYKCTRCSGWVHTSRPIVPAIATTTPTPTLSHAPPTEQNSDDSTLNVLQLNASGIGNKLIEIGVVLEQNKVKVAVIQESKLSPKFKNPCTRNNTAVRKDRPHGQGGGLLIFIHRSITFSKQPSSPESLSDPHLK